MYTARTLATLGYGSFTFQYRDHLSFWMRGLMLTRSSGALAVALPIQSSSGCRLFSKLPLLLFRLAHS